MCERYATCVWMGKLEWKLYVLKRVLPVVYFIHIHVYMFVYIQRQHKQHIKVHRIRENIVRDYITHIQFVLSGDDRVRRYVNYWIRIARSLHQSLWWRWRQTPAFWHVMYQIVCTIFNRVRALANRTIIFSHCCGDVLLIWCDTVICMSNISMEIDPQT